MQDAKINARTKSDGHRTPLDGFGTETGNRSQEVDLLDSTFDRASELRRLHRGIIERRLPQIPLL